MKLETNPYELPKMKEIWQKTLKWQPSEKQQQQFQSLYEEIIAGNKRLNLTRITTKEDFWEKHLWDSVAGIIYGDVAIELAEKKSLRAIDIGTGAGFPGIPIGIFSEQIEVTLLDSTRKKISFLEESIARLKLDNIKTLAGRAEDLCRKSDRRLAYDLATIRAVSKNAKVAAELTLPFLKIGGIGILYRGRWQPEETSALQKEVSKLGGILDRIETFTTPLSKSTRNCIYLRKIDSI